jgi:cytosine/uracil/thiamine/allantoin permease
MFSLYGQFYEQTDGMAVILQLSSMSEGLCMEDCVEMALEQVTHKLVCWFCYMVDNFMIPLHRPESLEKFLDH